MQLRERLLITFATVLLTSLVAGLAWRWIYGVDIAVFVIGAVGGVTAATAWQLLNRFDP